MPQPLQAVALAPATSSFMPQPLRAVALAPATGSFMPQPLRAVALAPATGFLVFLYFPIQMIRVRAAFGRFS